MVDFECPHGKPWGYQAGDRGNASPNAEPRTLNPEPRPAIVNRQSSITRTRLAVCRDCAQHGDAAGDGCAGCWCRLLLDPDGRPDRRAYKAVLRGERDCPAG